MIIMSKAFQSLEILIKIYLYYHDLLIVSTFIEFSATFNYCIIKCYMFQCVKNSIKYNNKMGFRIQIKKKFKNKKKHV